jgi:uncharacterized protein (TIGR02466 family)
MTFKNVNWGPFVYCGILDGKTIESVKKLCKKNKKNSANAKLAGHLQNQFDIDMNKYMDLISPWIREYIEKAELFYNRSIANSVTIKSAWVNFMQPKEFNPPHVHTDCHLSSVMFLDVPDLTDEIKEYKGTHHGPGALEFLYGEERYLNNHYYCVHPVKGEFYIFPANVKHFVSPFKTKGERISVAANFLIQQ